MINLTLLGPPRVEVDGRRVGFDTRKAMALLAYLALQRQFVQGIALSGTKG